MADTDLIERLKDYGLTLRENIVICDRRAVDEAATALAEKDARIAGLEAELIQSRNFWSDELSAKNAQLTASRSECEGLRPGSQSRPQPEGGGRMSEPTFEQITMAAIAFVGNDMWDSLDKFGKAKARTRARKALIVAAPSPSPAPGVVEALTAAKDFIALEYADARQEQYGEWLAPEARKVFGLICEALASLSQPAKGEREGGCE